MNRPRTPADPVVARLQSLPRLLLWVFAMRVKTLSLSIVPVIAGSWLAAAYGSWRVDIALVAACASAAIQIGTNLWNDAADAVSGVDGPGRLGPPRMTSLGLLEPSEVRRAAMMAFALAGLLGIYLAGIGGWPIVAIGLTSLALGYLYSKGPCPLSATPIGELLVVCFFGIIAVAGTVHLHGHAMTGDVAMLGILVGLPAAAVLLVNNHRDRRMDAESGRRTLAILLGVNPSRLLYLLLLLASVAVGYAFVPCPTAFAPVVLLGGVLALIMMSYPISSKLSRLIPGTALFQLLLLGAIVVGRVFCG